MVGPALIARQVGSLEAIFALRSLNREADAASLTRSLYEHAATFAWFAIDPNPERHQRFIKSDLQRRLEIDDDCRKLTLNGEPIEMMTKAQRADVEKQLAELPMRRRTCPM
ncbi:MAG: DUF5677 domain-containing protein [Actinomycetota bacterium]|nr:DUF5677 domain-containing protein [Actinomycetota bacterium]